MEFQWDDRKAEINLKKHGVSFREAASVFGDPLALTFDDPDHSIGAHRLPTFGTTRTGKLVFVSPYRTRWIHANR
ncbi:BrnT family toxin [Methylotetracoccus oryzae]|uniref:BrnT family toxin n=1 Tax=Methylotetracoccus oryzae TaxID=1919059 RepID=UPI00191340C0|nr:BrnT family toxin [Methylotetracoccus oryzae]